MFLYAAIYQRFTILLSEIELQLVKAAAAISPYHQSTKLSVVDFWLHIEIYYLIRSTNLKELILKTLSVGV